MDHPYYRSYSLNEYMKSITWEEYRPAMTNACKEVPLENDNDKVKLNFANLLGDTKITLNQNN